MTAVNQLQDFCHLVELSGLLSVYILDQCLATLFGKRPEVNISGFPGDRVCDAATQLCHCSTSAVWPLGNRVSINLYLHKPAGGLDLARVAQFAKP